MFVVISDDDIPGDNDVGSNDSGIGYDGDYGMFGSIKRNCKIVERFFKMNLLNAKCLQICEGRWMLHDETVGVCKVKY